MPARPPPVDSSPQPRRSDRTRAIATMPRAGPTARRRNAYLHPTASRNAGRRRIETTVIAKPIAVWAVTAVPTYSGSATSVSAVENWAESAITAVPHTSMSTTTTAGASPYSAAAATQQAPLTAIAPIVTAGRPRASARTPPRMQPASPATPMAVNAASSTAVRDGSPSPDAAKLAAAYAGTHVHIAYSSHMW